MKDVIITIKGTTPGETDEPVELVTNGEYCYSRDKTVFSYMESEITGMEGTRTTFTVAPDLVTLSREGTVNATMTFEKGRKHVFLYETDFGSTLLGVDTHDFSFELGENGGDMEFTYDVDVDNVLLGTSSFKINVREA